MEEPDSESPSVPPRPASPFMLHYTAGTAGPRRTAALAIASVTLGVTAILFTLFVAIGMRALLWDNFCLLALAAMMTPCVGLTLGVLGVDPRHERPLLAWLGILLNAIALLAPPLLLAGLRLP